MGMQRCGTGASRLWLGLDALVNLVLGLLLLWFPAELVPWLGVPGVGLGLLSAGAGGGAFRDRLGAGAGGATSGQRWARDARRDRDQPLWRVGGAGVAGDG